MEDLKNASVSDISKERREEIVDELIKRIKTHEGATNTNIYIEINKEENVFTPKEFTAIKDVLLKFGKMSEENNMLYFDNMADMAQNARRIDEDENGSENKQLANKQKLAQANEVKKNSTAFSRNRKFLAVGASAVAAAATYYMPEIAQIMPVTTAAIIGFTALPLLWAAPIKIAMTGVEKENEFRVQAFLKEAFGVTPNQENNIEIKEENTFKNNSAGVLENLKKLRNSMHLETTTPKLSIK